MLNLYKIYSSFSVPDLEKAKEFYSKTLGLEVKERPEGLDVKIGEEAKVFVYFSAHNKPADFTVLNFVVEDVEKEVDALLEKEVVMEKYDIPGIVTTDKKGIARRENNDEMGPHVMAWFKDPAGNIFAMSQKSKPTK